MQAVESKSTLRNCFKLPPSLGPLPEDGLLDGLGGWGTIPILEQLGLKEIKACQIFHSMSMDFLDECMILCQIME